MNETDKRPDVCQNQDEGLNETQGMPDGSRELSDSSHELPDGMEIDMSQYKEGSAAVSYTHLDVYKRQGHLRHQLHGQG